MNDIFLHVFNLAVTAGWIVLAVLVLRLILRRRLPGWVKVALWGVAGARLLFPFSLESVLSLIPSAEVVPPTITTSPAPTVNVGVPVVDQVINPVISQTMAPAPQASVNPMQILMAVATAVWLVGAVVMLIYFAICNIRLRRRLAISIPYRANVYLCDHLPTPILVGILRPRIYIPSDTDPSLYPYVLAHEGNHLKRGDHIWKPLGFLLLSVYWFHPLLWVAYLLLGRDMEQACDEKTVNKMSEGELQAYVKALTVCGTAKRAHGLPNPVAFGESKIFERVKHMMNYKKPKVWMSVIAVALIAATAVCFLTNPVSANEPDEPITPPNNQETTGTEQPTEQPKSFLEMAEEIKQAYLTYRRKDWSPADLIPYDCGEYNGAYVFVMYNTKISRYPVASEDDIGGVLFSYYDRNRLYVYRQGKVRELNEAYDYGMIASADLEQIKAAYQQVYPEIMSISKVQEIQVKQLFLERWNGSNLALEDIRLLEAGVYGQANAIYIFPLVASASVISTEIVGGYTFCYPNPFDRIWIYDGTTLYSLTEAYENGIMTEDGLKSLYETYQNS